MTKLFTCDEIAERYGVTKPTVWEWIRTKKLAAYKVGKSYRISEDHIKDFEKSKLTTV